MKTTDQKTREWAQAPTESERPRPEAGAGQGSGDALAFRPALGRPRRRAVLQAAGALAALGLTVGAFGQGSVMLDNSQSAGRLVVGEPGGPYEDYAGHYGLAVFELNFAGIDVNRINGQKNPAVYAPWLLFAGFTRVATFAGQDNSSSPGIVNLGELDMPDVSPKGATVALGLVVWPGDESYEQVFITGHSGGAVGFLAFINPTADYTAVPRPTPPALSGWAQDIAMYSSIPEPSALAMAALGGAVLLALRPRKR